MVYPLVTAPYFFNITICDASRICVGGIRIYYATNLWFPIILTVWDVVFTYQIVQRPPILRFSGAPLGGFQPFTPPGHEKNYTKKSLYH